MFRFFKKENRNSNLLKKGTLFCLVLGIVFFGALPLVANAQFQAIAALVPALSHYIVNPFDSLFILVAQTLLMVTSWILGAAGVLLNVAIKLAVVDFGSYANSAGVLLAWKTFRDVANMFFIFILLYIAIMTILEMGGIDLKKMLMRVIIIALLLNFSMFFTKLFIDGSNIIAIGFYNQLKEAPCSVGGPPAGGISEAFMCKLGLTDLYSVKTFNDLKGQGIPKIISYAIFGSGFMIIAAFVFIAAAIMFIGRSVIFIFLLILSPLAFISKAMPNDEYSGKWWKKLFAQCITAPAFLAFLWATFQVVSALSLDPNAALDPNVASAIKVAGGVDAAGNVIKASTSVGQTILNFSIVIGLLIGSLMVAIETGAVGASKVMGALQSTGKWTAGKLGRGAVRGTGIAWADRKFADTEFGKSWAGKGIRGATTGLVTGYNFGDKEGGSVQKVDKDRKKVQEDMAKDIIKGTEKKLDKELPARRAKKIQDARDAMAGIETERGGMDADMQRLEREIETTNNAIETARQMNRVLPQAQLDDHEENKERYAHLQAYEQELGKKRKEHEESIQTTEANIEKDKKISGGKKSYATKEEKKDWLWEIQKKKADELDPGTLKEWKGWKNRLTRLSYATDRGKVADELRKKAAGAGPDVGELISQAVSASGGSTPPAAPKP